MNVTQITAYLSIPCNFMLLYGDDPFYIDKLNSALEELTANSGKFKFPLFDLGVYNPEIRWVRDNLEIQQTRNHFPPSSFIEPEYLIIAIEVPFEEEENAVNNIPQIFMKRVYDLVIIANLCYPGLIELETFELVQDGIVVEHSFLPKMGAISIISAMEYSRQNNWPQFHEIKLVDAWEWLLNRKTYLEMEGFDNDRTSRALNAFSRLFEIPNWDVVTHLVWAMVGIEALYVQNKESIMAQVRDGVSAVLGEQESFKKEFNKMYDFRSKFIHGDMDIPGLYYLGDASDRLAKFETGLENTVSLATSILIASLQEIIKNNWSPK